MTGEAQPEGSELAAGHPAPLSRREWCLTAVLLGAAVAPLWVGRWLPVLDLPQHLGLAAIVARLGDAPGGLSRWYEMGPRLTPYWGYLAPMRALALALPLEIASKVLLSLYAAAVPLAAGWLLRELGRDPRWAVFSLPLVYGTNFFFGFEPFIVSTPVFLAALALTDRHLRSGLPAPRWALAAGAAAAAVFLCHVQTYLLYGLCTIVLAAVHARRGRWWLRTAALAPSVALFCAWAVPAFLRGGPVPVAHTVHYRSYGTVGRLGAKYESAREVLARIPERTVGAFNDGSDQALGAAAFVALLLAVALARADGAPAARRPLAAARRGELLAVVVLAAALLLPVEIAGQWYLAPRYLAFAALLAPAFVRGPAGDRRAVLAVAAAIGVAAFANVAVKVRAFQRQVAGYEAVAARLEPGRRLLGLPFDDGARGPLRLWPLLHWAAYYQVSPGGDVGFSFAGLPSIPVVYRPGMQAPHPYEWRPDQFEWSTMGRFYDYFLVSGVPRGAGGRDLAAHARVLQTAGAWSLWVPRDAERTAR